MISNKIKREVVEFLRKNPYAIRSRLAKIYGVNRGTIYKWCVEQGIPTRPVSRHTTLVRIDTELYEWLRAAKEPHERLTDVLNTAVSQYLGINSDETVSG